jgi:hypothetical protein
MTLKATRLLSTVAGTVAVDKGLTLLNNQSFMQSGEKVNFKKLGANGGALVAGVALSFMSSNDALEHVGYGVAGAGASQITDTLIDMFSQSDDDTVGATQDEIVSLYESDDDLGDIDDFFEEEEEIPLAGTVDEMVI